MDKSINQFRLKHRCTLITYVLHKEVNWMVNKLSNICKLERSYQPTTHDI